MKGLNIYQIQTIGKALAIYAETLKQRAKNDNWTNAELAAALADIDDAARATNCSSYIQNARGY
jgi:hypothetical protein